MLLEWSLWVISNHKTHYTFNPTPLCTFLSNPSISLLMVLEAGATKRPLNSCTNAQICFLCFPLLPSSTPKPDLLSLSIYFPLLLPLFLISVRAVEDGGPRRARRHPIIFSAAIYLTGGRDGGQRRKVQKQQRVWKRNNYLTKWDLSLKLVQGLIDRGYPNFFL